jgi:hypothetical protein
VRISTRYGSGIADGSDGTDTGLSISTVWLGTAQPYRTRYCPPGSGLVLGVRPGEPPADVEPGVAPGPEVAGEPEPVPVAQPARPSSASAAQETMNRRMRVRRTRGGTG